jgi:hypothetical protein
MRTVKFYCHPCDHVTQAPSVCYGTDAQRCRCGQPMRMMGDRWRPGRKGTRTRMWDDRQAKPVAPWMTPDRLRPATRTSRKRQRAMTEAARLVIPRWYRYRSSY